VLLFSVLAGVSWHISEFKMTVASPSEGNGTPLARTAPRARTGGLVTMIAPTKRGLAPGVAPTDLSPGKQLLVDNITRALESRVGFKTKLSTFWVRVKKHNLTRSSTMKPQKFEKFLKLVADDLGVPATIFGETKTIMEIYDFDGDQKICFSEGYKCVKHSLERYRRELGGHPVFEVETKTPEEVGLSLMRQLGKGGQGTANLVTNSSGVEFVLKVYDKSNANAAGIDDLIGEMEVMKKSASSTYIAVCHEIFQDGTNLYMLGDPYFGGDLTSLQHRARELDIDMNEEWYRDIFFQGFSGLAYLHQKAILHCDIKEENIMVKKAEFKRPEVVIIDLGLASTTLTASIRGTPGYMPPEVWSHSTWYPKGDVFSMGVVCFQMMTDNVPNAKLRKLGVFQRGARTIEEVVQLTMTVQPNFDKISPYNDDLSTLLRLVLEKDWRKRLPPLSVLKSDYFKGPDTTCLTGLFRIRKDA
jgi:hypothetical protein